MADEPEERPLPSHLSITAESIVDRLLLTLLIAEFARRLDSPKEARQFIEALRFRVDEYVQGTYSGDGEFDAAMKKRVLSSTDKVLQAVKIGSGAS